MRRRRLKRRMLLGGVIFALLLIYLAISVVRVGAAARGLMTRKARPAGLSLRSAPSSTTSAAARSAP
jgi:hypothetical protein